MNRRILILVSIVSVLSFSSCVKKTEVKNSGKIGIVATMFPQFDFARAIAGDKAEITMLLKPGAESHSYEPTPRDMKKIQNADLFIYTGGENDVWADTMLESLGDKAPKTLRLLDLVEAVEEEIVEGMTSDEEKEEGEDSEEEIEYDEHVWTSPLNAKKITNAICNELCSIDSENESIYRNNCSRYIEELEKLDASFREVVANGNRKMLVFGDRFPFRYFADEYGLSYFAAFPGCATDVEVSASTIRFLINKINEEKIPVVLTIEFSNGKIADTLCEATGAAKMEFHSCHNVSADNIKTGETYVSLMKRNVEVLKKALE